MQPGSSAQEPAHHAHSHHKPSHSHHQHKGHAKSKPPRDHTKPKAAPRKDIEFQPINKDGDSDTDNDKAGNKPANDVRVGFPPMTPPNIDLTGREVLFAIAVFFFLSVSVGLVVVLVDTKIQEINAIKKDDARRRQERLERLANPPRKDCVTVDCLRASVQMLESMNSSLSYCGDFYQYACGGWIHKASVPSHRHYWSITKEMEATVDEHIKQLLTSEALDEEDEGEEMQRRKKRRRRRRKREEPAVLRDAPSKARHMYMQCMDVEDVESRGVQPFRDIVDSMGGWAIAGTQPN